MRDRSCEQIKADLTDYMNRDLEAAHSQRIRLHLSNCASCESFLVSLESVDTLVDDDPRVEPSADLQSRFMTRLEEHRARRSNSGTGASAFGWWQSLVQWSLPRQVLAAGVLASLVVLVFYGGPLTQAPSSSSSEALLTEMPMVEDLSLYRDMQVIENLDFLEDFDVIDSLSPGNGPSSTLQ